MIVPEGECVGFKFQLSPIGLKLFDAFLQLSLHGLELVDTYLELHYILFVFISGLMEGVK